MASARESITARGAGVERAAPGEVRVRRALLSVSDKRGIVDFAQGLAQLGVEIVSTGGTARELGGAGLQPREIEDFTGFPEMMDGRVKTLHPRLYAGLLALRDEDSHLDAAREQQIEQVDLVCVNLYPFEQTLARGDASEQEIVENIDIGGPTMIRAAAKNSAFAAVVVDPEDYEPVLAELRESDGRLSLQTRTRLAAKAFALTARYDAAIATWFARRVYDGFPPTWNDAYEKVLDLRYGENPHQRGRVLRARRRADAPARRRAPAARQGAVVQQPARPQLGARARRGVRAAGVRDRQAQQPVRLRRCRDGQLAYERAFACDPESAYGGVIAVNRRVDAAFARELSKQFIEVLLAPGFDADALAVLTEKKNVRLLELSAWPAPAHEVEGKPVIGGQLVQTRDVVSETREQMRVMTARARRARSEWRGSAVRVEGLPPRALQRDRDRRAGRTAPRSGSAPAR